MKNNQTTKGQLLNKINHLKDKIVELEKSVSENISVKQANIQIKNKLRETNEYLANLINYANAPIIVWNPESRITRFNHAFEHLTGYKADEVIGKELDILFPQVSRENSLNEIRRTLSGEYWESVEIPIVRKDGDVRIVLWNSANIHAEDGTTLLATIAQGQDITERKSIEKQIKTSLKEKEILLREIHHRVKNNLQVISSLLNLQAKYIKDKHAQKLFIESQNRIRSMALVHEELYKSKNLSKINFSEYIQNLAAYLFRSYGVNQDAITLKINIENESLSINKSINLGLIINELIANSLKHAFPKGKKGKINIELYSDAADRLTLIFSDNGIGLPKELDFRNTKTLGLQLVNTLTDEMDGIIALARGRGTKFKIRFNINTEKDI